MGDPLERYLTIETEDDLTRVVFGLLELLGPTILAAVLDIPPQIRSEEWTIAYHERLDPRAERIPDVVLKGPETTILVEVKRGATIDQSQLRREHEELQRFGTGQKQLLFISGHESPPSQLAELDLSSVEWCGWKEIALRISRYDRKDVTETQYQLLTLLQQILKKEGYLPFTGFSNAILDELPTILERLTAYHNQIAQFHRELDGLLAETRLKPKNMWRDGISQDFTQFPNEGQFTATHVWIAYGESDVAIKAKAQQYLFVAFCIEGGKTPMVRVGFSLSPKQSEKNQKRLVENAEEIVAFIRETEASLLQTDRNFHVIERLDGEKEISEILHTTEALQNIPRVQIALEYGPDALTQEAITTLVADDLVTLHEFTHPRLYP